MILVGAALVALYFYSKNKGKIPIPAPAAGSQKPITNPTQGTANTGVNSGLNGTLIGLENVVGTELLNWWHGISKSNTPTYANNDVSAPVDNSAINSSYLA